MASSKSTSEQQPVETLAKGVSQADEQRVTELNNLQLLQGIKDAVMNLELQRLTEKHGSDHPRVQKISARIEYNRYLFTGLEKEIEKSSAPTEPLPVNSWRLNGKVRDANKQPAAGITVFLADQQNNWIRELGSACSDQNGYYTLTIDEKQIGVAGKAAYIAASDKKQHSLYSSENIFAPAKGIIDYFDIDLGDAQCVSPPAKETGKK